MAVNEYELIRFDETLTHRFWSKIEKRSDRECWSWIAGKRSGRYGSIRIGGKRGPMVAAHRIAYALCKGDPSGFNVLHECDNTLCCNPAHLFLGTQADNVADMLSKGRGRALSGPENGNAILTEDQVREMRIRAAREERPKSIAAAMGLPYLVIYNALSGKTYEGVASEIQHKAPSQLRPGRKPKPIRTARGVARRQMTDDQAREAYQLARQGEMTAQAIASRYGVSDALIYAIKHRRAYQWATKEPADA